MEVEHFDTPQAKNIIGNVNQIILQVYDFDREVQVLRKKGKDPKKKPVV